MMDTLNALVAFLNFVFVPGMAAAAPPHSRRPAFRDSYLGHASCV
jgi:hypothetical protein